MDNQASKTHYVCPGTCGGVSEAAKNCDDTSCTFYGQPLHKCDCEDGSHRGEIPANSAPEPA